MLKIPRYLEYIFVCFALWFLIGNPINLITSGGAGQLVDVYTENRNALLPTISMAIYAMSSGLLICRWKLVLERLRSNPQAILIILFLAIVVCSSQWSADPSRTSRRSILLVGSTSLAFFLSTGFSFKQQLRFLSVALCMNVMLCFIFGALLPHYGLMPDGVHIGAWRGVYTHKNKLGAQMALTTVFLMVVQHAKLFKGKVNVALLANIVMSTFMVLVSKSTTGLLATATLTLTFIICNTLKLSYRYMVITISSIVLLAGSASIYIQTNADDLLSAVGKGTDLSGRGDLWPAAWYMISQRPFLGYGYEGFWGEYGSPADLLRQIVGWPAPNAHSGFLEALLAVGWLGSSLLLIALVMSTIKALRLVRVTKQSYAICPVVIIVFLVLSNMTESTLFNHDVWLMLIWTCLSSVAIFQTWSESNHEQAHIRSDTRESVEASP